MQIIDANTLVGTSVEGQKGSFTLMPAFQDERLGAQIIVVPPGVKGPKPGQKVKDRTVLFVLQGSATLSNSEFYQRITPGKLVILEPGEERVFQTEKEKFICLEVRMGPAPAPEPTQVQNLLFEAPPVPQAATEAAPKKASGMYIET